MKQSHIPVLPLSGGGTAVLTELAVAYQDTSVDQLRWRLGLPPQAALAERATRIGTLRVDMRLLGASHQLTVAEAGRQVVSETVACVVGEPGEVPAGARRLTRRWSYRFALRVTAPARGRAFAERVEAVEQVLGRSEHTLAGAFPGLPGALTAIRVRPTADGLRWDTWHCYPQSGEIACTRSLLRRR